MSDILENTPEGALPATEEQYGSQFVDVEPDRLARAQEAANRVMAQTPTEEGPFDDDADVEASADAELQAAQAAKAEKPSPADGSDNAAPAEDEPAGEPPAAKDPPEDRSARAALAAEKRLRDERDALAAAKAQLEREKQEFLARVRAGDVDGAFKAYDPEVDTLSVAEDVYYSRQGEAAPPEYRVQRERRQLEMERQAFAREQESAQQAAHAAEAARIMDGVRGAVETLDGEAYPVVQKLVDVYGDAKVQGIVEQAFANALNNGIVATPEQLLQVITDEFAPLIGLPDSGSQVASTEETTAPSTDSNAGARKPRSLRNNMSQSRAPSKPYEEMTEKEIQAARLARARKAAADAMERDRDK